MKQLLNSLGIQRQDRTKYENPEYADGWNDLYDKLVFMGDDIACCINIKSSKKDDEDNG